MAAGAPGGCGTPGVTSELASGPGSCPAEGPGKAEKNWFARRSSSRAKRAGSAFGSASCETSLVLMVLADVDVLEHAHRVFRQDGEGAVQRHQVRRRAPVVDAHPADREAGAHLAGHARLEQPDHAALLLASAQE